MSGSRLFRAFLITVATSIAIVVIYYAIFFEGQLSGYNVVPGHNDTALHVVAFLSLSVPLLLLGPWGRTVAGLAILAGLIEVVQMFELTRTADWGDFAASVAGICLGSLVVLVFHRIKLLVKWSEKQTDE